MDTQPARHNVAIEAYRKDGHLYVWVDFTGDPSVVAFAYKAIAMGTTMTVQGSEMPSGSAYIYELRGEQDLASFVSLITGIASLNETSDTFVICERSQEHGHIPLRPFLAELLKEQIRVTKDRLQAQEAVLASIEEGQTTVHI